MGNILLGCKREAGNASLIEKAEHIGYVDLNNTAVSPKIIEDFVDIVLQAKDPKLCEWAVKCLGNVRSKDFDQLLLINNAILRVSGKFKGAILSTSIRSLTNLYLNNDIR